MLASLKGWESSVNVRGISCLAGTRGARRDNGWKTREDSGYSSCRTSTRLSAHFYVSLPLSLFFFYSFCITSLLPTHFFFACPHPPPPLSPSLLSFCITVSPTSPLPASSLKQIIALPPPLAHIHKHSLWHWRTYKHTHEHIQTHFETLCISTTYSTTTSSPPSGAQAWTCLEHPVQSKCDPTCDKILLQAK